MSVLIQGGVTFGPTRIPVIQSGLLLDLDAGNLSSYPGSGSVWTDLSGNGNTTTLVNSPTFASTIGGELLFNHSNQYATVNNNAMFNINTITMSITAKHTFITQYSGQVQQLINKTSSSGYAIRMNYGDNLMIEGAVWTGAAYQTAGMLIPGILTTNKWYHYTMTYNGTNIKFFWNGVLQATTAATGTITTNAEILSIGAKNTAGVVSNYFDGSVGEVQVYNRGLTDGEVLYNFNAHKTRYQF